MPNHVAVFYFFTGTSLDEGKIIKDSDISTVIVVLLIQDGLLKII